MLVGSSTVGSVAVHIRFLFTPPVPPCVKCTVSETYRSINKTIKQQFSLPLLHSTATEYIHFSFPLSGTLASRSEGVREEMRWKKGGGGLRADAICRKVCQKRTQVRERERACGERDIREIEGKSTR